MNLKFRFNIWILNAIIIVSILFIIIYFNFFNIKGDKHQYPAPFLTVDPSWADTTLKYMSLDEKIGQLIFFDAGKIKEGNKDSILSILNETFPGGIKFMTDSISDFIKIQNNLQAISKINPFTSLYVNNGISNFKDFEYFQGVESVLAVNDDSIRSEYLSFFYEFYSALNLSLVECNKKYFNSIDTAFDKDHLSFLDSFIKLSNKNHLISVLDADNFFPEDSIHYNLNSNFFTEGLSGLCLNENKKTKNPYGIAENYKDELQFNGLEISKINSNQLLEDSIKDLFSSGKEILFTENPLELKSILKNLIKDEIIEEEVINLTVRKILLAKTWTGINKNNELNFDSLKSKVDKYSADILRRRLLKKAVILVKKDNNFPYKRLNESYTVIQIGNSELLTFNEIFKEYRAPNAKYFSENDQNLKNYLNKINKSSNLIILLNMFKIDSDFIHMLTENSNVKSLNLINIAESENLFYCDSFDNVIQVYDNSNITQKYAADAIFGGIDISGKLPVELNDTLHYGKSLISKKIRVSNAKPGDLDMNGEILSKIDSIANDGIRRGAFPGCQIVILKNGFSIYNKAFGYHTYSKVRKVQKTDLYDLASVTKIAATTIAAMRMYDKGKLRLNDQLGRYFKDTKIDYSNIEPDTILNIDTLKVSEVKDFKKLLKIRDTVHINDSVFIAYDTLIVTTTPSNNIFKVKIKDLLLHKSGITPTLPILPYLMYKKYFYDSLELIKERYYAKLKSDTIGYDTSLVFDVREEIKKLHDEYFTRRYIEDSAEIKIADGFYFQNRYFDTLWRDTKRLRVYSRKIYQYTDINMILLQQAIDSINRRSLDKYLAYNIYRPMGLQTMCYKAWKHFPRSRITPTEDDKYWREQLLRGNVHDPSAAMLGGISGNAGLFSDAYDLAVLGQMLLNGGTYGGVRYISEATVKRFTGFQEDSHRGLGFDKPTKKSIVGEGAPPESFGHTGFTGTCIWVDPVNQIVFVFLSNRVHPNSKNWRINTLRIRQKIHTKVYESLIKSD